MKIGILTYHCVPNFGAQLQTISTVGYLKKLGHEPVVLHWYPEDLRNIYATGRVPHTQIEAHDELTSELPLSELCMTEDELVEEVNSLNLDAIIAGSDALFKYQPEKTRRYFSKRKLKYIVTKCVLVEMLEGNPFFGGFLHRLNKPLPAAAFSVSSQNCLYHLMTRRERKLMRKSLSGYRYISVRDEWTRKMMTKVTGNENVFITPDPVFSINQNFFVPLPQIEDLKEKYGIIGNYVLLSFSTHFVDSEYVGRLVNEIEARGLQPVAFPMPEGCFDFGMPCKISLPISPLEWYVLIQNASAYIGERMHPIVVAIHNNVPFFSFDEYGFKEKSIFCRKPRYRRDSSKTYLILERAGLTDYIYSYKGEGAIPEVSEVLDKIESFDKIKCADFASKYQNYYEESMKNVLKVLRS